MNDLILSARGIHRSFQMGTHSLRILKGLDLDVRAGEALCIVGASGAGKSTLLQIMGTLDRPTMGRVYHRGDDLCQLSDEELATFRNDKLGFVFQFHHLLSEFTALENVSLPDRIGGRAKSEALAAAEELLVKIGLGDRLNHYPSELSGGEKQRVAIARALIRRPEIILADEPTGNLDTENALRIQDLFFRLKDELGLTLIAVTHDRDFAKKFRRVLTLKDGMWAAE